MKMVVNKTVLIAALLVPAVALAGASASSFKKGGREGANAWNANAAIDGDLATAWMVPGESPNRGEWILIDVPKSTVDKIAIFPGWGKDAESYSDYPRVKQLKVDILCCADSEQMKTTGTAQVDVADKAEMQIIDIPDLAVGDDLFGGKVKIWITDIYEGVDYPNLAVSELTVILKEFDAAATLTDSSEEAEGHLILDMQDLKKTTFWATPAAGAQFSFEASGFGLSSFEFDDGPAGYARVKTVKVTANDRVSVTTVADKTGAHKVDIPGPYGYTGSAWGSIKVEVLEVYPGTKPELAISEFRAKATNFEGL